MCELCLRAFLMFKHRSTSNLFNMFQQPVFIFKCYYVDLKMSAKFYVLLFRNYKSYIYIYICYRMALHNKILHQKYILHCILEDISSIIYYYYYWIVFL